MCGESSGGVGSGGETGGHDVSFGSTTGDIDSMSDYGGGRGGMSSGIGYTDRDLANIAASRGAVASDFGPMGAYGLSGWGRDYGRDVQAAIARTSGTPSARAQAFEKDLAQRAYKNALVEGAVNQAMMQGYNPMTAVRSIDAIYSGKMGEVPGSLGGLAGAVNQAHSSQGLMGKIGDIFGQEKKDVETETEKAVRAIQKGWVNPETGEATTAAALAGLAPTLSKLSPIIGEGVASTFDSPYAGVAVSQLGKAGAEYASPSTTLGDVIGYAGSIGSLFGIPAIGPAASLIGMGLNYASMADDMTAAGWTPPGLNDPDVSPESISGGNYMQPEPGNVAQALVSPDPVVRRAGYDWYSNPWWSKVR